MTTRVLVATQSEVLVVDPVRGQVHRAGGLAGRLPTCLATDPLAPERGWCGTQRGGVYRSEDAGTTWAPAGLADERVTAIATSPARAGRVWVGTEPSAVWRTDGATGRWQRTAALDALPSSATWAFPPRPETHHVRWIACHPADPDRLWVAVEAGALIRTADGGRSWVDRVPGGPWDTHELAVHPDLPDGLQVAAGDGYYESNDAGETWASPDRGLEVGYLRSVAIDPGDPAIILVSAASRPRTAYVAGRSDGRVYRRAGGGPWTRVTHGWPDPPETIAPLLVAGNSPGELWAADERGVHRSEDGGVHWRRVAPVEPAPQNLRGLGIVGGPP